MLSTFLIHCLPFLTPNFFLYHCLRDVNERGNREALRGRVLSFGLMPSQREQRVGAGFRPAHVCIVSRDMYAYDQISQQQEQLQQTTTTEVTATITTKGKNRIQKRQRKKNVSRIVWGPPFSTGHANNRETAALSPNATKRDTEKTCKTTKLCLHRTPVRFLPPKFLFPSHIHVHTSARQY